MLGEQGQLKLLVNLTSNKVSFVEFQTWIAWMWKHRRCWLKGLTQGCIMFAFLLGQTQSPFENKLLVACNVKPSVIRFCKVLILTLQRKPRSNVRFVSIPPCPCEVPNVFANLDR